MLFGWGCENEKPQVAQVAEPAAVDVSGDWTMHRSPGTFESEDQCTMTFTQNGNELSASVGGTPFAVFYWPGQINGTMSGTNLDLTWRYYSVGATYYLKGGVGVDDKGQGVMGGTWIDAAGRSGEWKAEGAMQTYGLF
jgi:hypothetical protein